MHQDIRSKNRTISRNMFERSKKRERYNKSPQEIMTMNISIIYNTLFNDYLNNNIDLLRGAKISSDSSLMISIIEDNKLTEKNLKSLNPTALVGGFLILSNDGKSIDSNKVNIIFDAKVINFFKNQKVKEEDIIRYARFWMTFFQNQ